jgi:hypothetical protein
MKQQRCFYALALTLGVAPVALAQAPAPVTPTDLDRTQFRASARALGMGGTDLIMTGDAAAAAFNPASIGAAGSYSQTDTVVGRTSNIHVSKINDLANGLKDLGNQFNSGNNSLAGVRDAFQKVYNFATDAGANDQNGTPATLSASLAPAAGFSVKNIGIVAYGTLAAKVGLTPTAIAVPGLIGPTGKITVGYGVLGLSNFALAFSLPVKVGVVGISPRITQASFAAAGFLADETDASNGFDTTVSPTTPNGNITGATYKEVHQQKFDIDLGFTSIPDPVYHIQGAIVVHNLLSPTYHLPRVINGNSLGVIPLGDFNFQMKPQVDVGGLSTYQGITYAAELHNLGNVNGGKRSFHAGVEYNLGKMLFLRGGYDTSRFVAGLGFGTPSFRLDLATGTNPQEQVALSLTFSGK